MKWSASKKSLVKIVPLGKSAQIAPKKKGKTKITAEAMDGSGKKATVTLNILPFVSDKTPAPTAPPDTRKFTKIEDFEGYNVGTTWDKYTAAGFANPGHMTVVTDPENPNNKCLEVKLDGTDAAYDFAPVFNVDVSKLTDNEGKSAAGKTLGSYTGIRADLRVVGDDSDIRYKKVYCYFDQYGKIAKTDKFAANANKTSSAHVKPVGDSCEAVPAGDPSEDRSFRFGVEISMAEGSDKENGVTLFNGTESKESNKYFPGFYDSFKPAVQNTWYAKNTCSTGFKLKEADGKVGFATRSLGFMTSRINEADSTLLKQSKFDIVLGSTYQGAKTYNTLNPPTSVTLYYDNIGFLEEDIPITGLKVSLDGEAKVAVGSELKLGLTFEPADTTQRSVNWTVNNDKVTVDSEGKIKVAEDFVFDVGTTEKKIVVTATSAVNPALTSSFEVTVYKADEVTEPLVLDLAALYDTETKFTTSDGTESGLQEGITVETVTTEEGKTAYKLAGITHKNQRAYFKLPEAIDLSAYESVEITGNVAGQMTFDAYNVNFNKGAENWYKKSVLKTYPFFNGSRPLRPDEEIPFEASMLTDPKYVGEASDPLHDKYVSEIKSYESVGKIAAGTAMGPNGIETFDAKLSDIRGDETDWSKTQWFCLGSGDVLPYFYNEDLYDDEKYPGTESGDPLPEYMAVEKDWLIYSVRLIPKGYKEPGADTGSVEAPAQ